MSAGRTSAIPLEIRSYLDTLADRLQSGHAAVMVGSGFSKNAAPSASAAPFPDWSQLGDRFRKELSRRGQAQQPQYMQIPALAHEIEAAYGRSQLNHILQDAIPDSQHGPSSLHIDLLDLPWTDVFTTNYDTLLERACRSVASPRYDIVRKPDDLGQATQPRIVKLHGTLGVSELIVTDEDYRKYQQDFAPFVNTVRQALLEKTLCLIGFSGDDPNFQHWVGWIRDHLSNAASPKPYLIAVRPLTHSQRRLHEHRHIIPIDMSECSGGDGNPTAALATLVEYLNTRISNVNSLDEYPNTRISDANPLDWPGTSGSNMAFAAASDIDHLLTAWKSQRRSYPGWVIVPDTNREVLWRDTQNVLRQLPHITTILGSRDLEFAFELTWRTEKCLLPLLDGQENLLESVVAAHWPLPPASGAGRHRGRGNQEPHPTGLPRPPVAVMCFHLLLALMRDYREEGLSDKWTQTCERLDSVKDTLPPELMARLQHEKVMFAMFSFDLEGMRIHLQQWTENKALPFWSAKKAAILAELGRPGQATRILEESLQELRLASNLRPTGTDYKLLSEESYVMLLLHMLRLRLIHDTERSDDLEKDREVFADRWHALRQYKCDPWQDWETFKHKLTPEPNPQKSTDVNATFDIGHIRRNWRISIWDNEALLAYGFLRFSEDSGLPFRIPGVAIASEAAVHTLRRIEGHSRHWAVTTLVRIGASKAVDELFDRPALARMDQESVDALVGRYLTVLRSAMPDIERGSRGGDENLAVVLAGIMPEILSRLCSRCSYEAKEDLLEFLLAVYESEHKLKYQGIGSLVRRLVGSCQSHEIARMIPEFLQFAIPTGPAEVQSREFPNPFTFVDSTSTGSIDGGLGGPDVLGDVLDMASSGEANARKWALTTLGALHYWQLLGPDETASFGNVLWQQVGDDGLPISIPFRRYALLEFPHPSHVSPVQTFMEYVRAACIAVQTGDGLLLVTPEELCGDIREARRASWPDADVRRIVRCLVAWSEKDRNLLKLLKLQEETAGGELPFSGAGKLKAWLVQVAWTMALVIARHWTAVREADMLDDLRRVVDESSRMGVETLALEMALTSLFPETRSRVLKRVEDGVCSWRKAVMEDALRAILVESERIGHGGGAVDEEFADLRRLLDIVSQVIRHGSGATLVSAMQVMADLVERHEWCLRGNCERRILVRIRGVIQETAHKAAGSTGRHGQVERRDVDMKLQVRRRAAMLAYRLYSTYRSGDKSVPVEIQEWKGICESKSEFGEIRRQWLPFRSDEEMTVDDG